MKNIIIRHNHNESLSRLCKMCRVHRDTVCLQSDTYAGDDITFILVHILLVMRHAA